MKVGSISIARLGGLAAVAAVAFAIAAFPAKAHAASSVRLMVDPGHGGSDPGAVGGPLQEKDSSLKISKMIVDSAHRQGWDVALTRNDDRFVGLVERPQAAARFKANAFVSVHSNSTGPKGFGNMTIYRTAAGARLGQRIMNELAPLTPYPDLGNRADVRGLAVLRHASMPATLVELLSVTNTTENRALRDQASQQRMAEAIVRGIARYYNVKYYPPAVPKPAAKPAPKAQTTTAPKPQPTVTPQATQPAKPQQPAAPKAEPQTARKAAAQEHVAPTRSGRTQAVERRQPKAADETRMPTSLVSLVWSLLFK